MLSNKMSAAEEDEVLEELAALQAEQVKAQVSSLFEFQVDRDKLKHAVQLPDAPLHGLPEREPAAPVAEVAPEPEGRQAIAA